MIMEDQNRTPKCSKFPAYLKQPLPHSPPQDGTLGIEDTSQLEQQTLGEKICLMCVSIALFIPVVLFLLHAIHSKMYSYHQKPLFQIESVRVFPFNLTSSRITANWNITLSILNPKNNPIRYENWIGTVYLRSENVSSSNIGNFTLDGNKNRKKRMTVNFGALNVYINKTVGEGIIAQRKEELGVVSFSLELEGIGRMYPGGTSGYEERVRVIVVHCVDIKVLFASSNRVGTLLDGPLKCQTAVVPQDKSGKDLPIEAYYGMHNSGNLNS